jgi:ABC-2 type transport system permease protein
MMSKISLIIKREYSSRVMKKSFLVVTILVPLLIAGLGFLAMWMSVEETKQVRVLVIDPANLCGGKIYVGNDPNPPVKFYFQEKEVLPDDFQNREDLQSYDILLGIDAKVITNKHIKAFYREKPSARVEYYIRNKIELRMEEYFAMDRGISLSEYRIIRQEFNFILENIDPLKDDTEIMYAQGVGFVFSIFIFIFILIYSSQVMRGVIEEKTSRVVEILVSSVKPVQLMLGKIIGIGLVGLTQFAIWIVLITLALFLMRSFVFQDILDPSTLADAMGPLDGMSNNVQSTILKDSDLIYIIYNGIPWATLLTFFVLYFVGGYLLYGGLFAVIGSAVDSETDSQQVMIPVMLPLLFSYVIGIMVIFNPGGPAALWFSQIPFSSPIIMLQRIAAGTVGVWEVFLSLGLLTLTFVVILYGAAKVYRTGILMYGKKATWREIIKWLRY